MLPDKQPQTEEEAREVGRRLPYWSQPGAEELKILSYRVADLLTPRTLAPFFPCEGLPLPRFTEGSWSPQMSDSIRISKGKKPIKHMLARLLPVSIPRVDVYALKARMTGRFTGELENIGEVFLASGDMQSWLKVKAYELLQGLRSGSSPVTQGQALEYELTFEVSGWNMVKELWNYMWSRTIEAKLTANLRVEGYETPDYTVEPFEKSFEITATLPVKEMVWHPW